VRTRGQPQSGTKPTLQRPDKKTATLNHINHAVLELVLALDAQAGKIVEDSMYRHAGKR